MPHDAPLRSPPPPRIVIIGGGFSGAAVALNLLRKLPPGAASITLVEPRNLLGGGVAYSSTDPAQRLNVPATRMLVLCEEPGAFEAWFKSSGALAEDPEALLEDGRIYPRRSAFGQYLDRLLREAAAAPGALPFRHVRANAESVQPKGSGFRVFTEDGGLLAADLLVLAVSHPPPGVPHPLGPIAGHQKFVGNPWVQDALGVIGRQDRVLIIGTALSTADVIASLKAQDHRGKILAVSRRGLVSRVRKMAQAEPFGDFSADPSRSAVALLRRTRRVIAKAEASGSSWGAVIDAMRVQGLTIWSALPQAEKSRVLRHLRTFWDVHRYQVAPQLASITEAERAAGALEIRAARIESGRLDGGAMSVELKFRGEDPVWEAFDAVVNCTGPDHGQVIRTNKALASLNQAGLIEPDGFGLGLQTDLTARALNAAGRAHASLFVAGPLARAAFGELMGLPQVSQHAALVAEEIRKALSK
jgi:uncharacterized NAD(P)/FAD-binding protein YdhS